MSLSPTYPMISRAIEAGSMDMLRHATSEGESLKEFEKQQGKSAIGEMVIASIRKNTDPPIVSEMLRMGANPNAPCGNGLSPLVFIIIRWPGERVGLTEAILSLLCAGANVDEPVSAEISELGWKPQAMVARSYPLSLAIQMGLHAPVEALILAGAPVDGPTGEDFLSPLSIAAFWKEESLAALLLACGANARHQNFDGKTALHFCWDRATAQMLIDHGALVSQKDHAGGTPLHEWTARANDLETIEWLAALAPMDRYEANVRGRTPLDTLSERFDRDTINTSWVGVLLASWRADMLQGQTGQAQGGGACGRL